MGRKKGCQKTGGRKSGTPNRLTSDLKQWISDLIDNNRDKIEKDLQKLEPKDRLAIMERMLRYLLPTGFNIIQKDSGGELELLKRIEEREPKLAQWIKGKYIPNSGEIIIGFKDYADYSDPERLILELNPHDNGNK